MLTAKNRIILLTICISFVFSAFCIITAFAHPDQSSETLNNISTYYVYTANDLNTLSQEVKNGNDFFGCTINLMNNISLDKTNYCCIGNSGKEFNGTFEGNNHIIDYLSFKNGYGVFVGLFGKVGKYGVVKNVSLGENSIIRGTAFVGGIAGQNDGLIYNCSSKADVSAKFSYVGGIVGFNSKNGRIFNCSLYCSDSSAKVTCDYNQFKPDDIFVGRNLGIMERCKIFFLLPLPLGN